MVSDALTKGQTVENTTKQIQLSTEHEESQSVSICHQYLQVKCSFYLTCTLEESLHLHHYIQTSWCLCVTVHGVAIIRTFTTSVHTPFT